MNFIEEEFIASSNITNTQVLINIPTHYVNVTGKNNKSTKNLRVIEYSVLCDLMQNALLIESESYPQQLEICHDLMQLFIGGLKDDPLAIEVSSLIEQLTKIGKDINLQDEFIALDTTPISFDSFHQFITNEHTHILENAYTTTIRGYHCYSELPEGDRARFREMFNPSDTDYNRIQWILYNFTRSLRFDNDRVLDKTIKVTNICLLF